jgi:glycerol-3-phosphate dehydrogenase
VADKSAKERMTLVTVAAPDNGCCVRVTRVANLSFRVYTSEDIFGALVEVDRKPRLQGINT